VLVRGHLIHWMARSCASKYLFIVLGDQFVC